MWLERYVEFNVDLVKGLLEEIPKAFYYYKRRKITDLYMMI